MTKEDRAARKAAIPALAISDGGVVITAGSGQMLLQMANITAEDAEYEYFNLTTVALREQLELIRYLIGAYNWQVRQANQDAEAGLPALARLVKVEPPAE